MNCEGRGKYKGESNLSNMIILGDEAHNMVTPGDGFDHKQQKRMLEAGSKLLESKESRVILFTGTPTVNGEENEFDELMKIVMGKEACKKDAAEGYITSVVKRPSPAFPVIDVANSGMPNKIEVPLKGKQLKTYITHRYLSAFSRTKSPRTSKNDKDTIICKNKDEMLKKSKCKNAHSECYEKHKKGLDWDAAIQRIENTGLYEQICSESKRKATGGNPCDDKLLGEMEDGSKLKQIAQDIAEGERTVIITYRDKGYYNNNVILALEKLVKDRAENLGMKKNEDILVVKFKTPPKNNKAKPPCEVDEFNKDKEKPKVLILTAEEYSESISLYGVHRLIFPDRR